MDYSNFRRSNNVVDTRDVPMDKPNRGQYTLGEKLSSLGRDVASKPAAHPIEFAGAMARKAGIDTTLGFPGADNAPSGSLEDQAGANEPYWNDPRKQDEATFGKKTTPDDQLPDDSGTMGVNQGNGGIAHIITGIDDGTEQKPQQGASLDDALNVVDQVMQYGRQLHGLGGSDDQGRAQDQDQSQDQGEAPDAGSDEAVPSMADGGDVKALPIGALPPVQDQHAMEMSQVGRQAAQRAQDAATKRSSGTTPSFADGGDVTDDANVEPQAAPSGDDEEAIPANAQPTEYQAPQGGQAALPDGQDGNPQAKLASYVQGEGAVDHHTAQAWIERAAQMYGTKDQDEAKLAAVTSPELAPEEKWGLLQYFRKALDSARSYAVSAATGTQQKPADIQDSLKAANAAFSNVPDGVKMHLSMAPGAGDGGQAAVFLTASKLGENRPFLHEALSPAEYKSFLTHADMDTLHSQGPAAVLQKAKQEAQQATNPPPQAPMPLNPATASTLGIGGQQAQAPGAPPQAAGAPQAGAPGGPPSQTSMIPKPEIKPATKKEDQQNEYSNSFGSWKVNRALDARAQSLFPGNPQKQADWIHGIEQEQEQNKIAEMKAKNPLGVAQLREEGANKRAAYKAAYTQDRTAVIKEIGDMRNLIAAQNGPLAHILGLGQAALSRGDDWDTVNAQISNLTGGRQLADFLGNPALISKYKDFTQPTPGTQVKTPAPTMSGPPQGAIDMLKNDPTLKPAFELKYGQGAAARYLGGQ